MSHVCVICGARYVPKREDSTSCGRNACRCKLSRLRRKARKDAGVRIFTPNEQMMLAWLSQHVPAAEAELRTLHTVYGKDAFKHAARAIGALAGYHRGGGAAP